jgi:NADPH:quinone reductase-like Zn-dependent oxidoreductase
MQAYVCRRYGRPEVVKLVGVPKPEPKDNEVLTKTRATTATTAA